MIKHLLPTLAAVVVLTFCGVVHGLWTDRWVGQEEMDDVLARLESVPMVIGEWQAEDVKPPKQRPREAMASMSRRYVHRGTGQSVTLFVAGGRPGPVSIHTPDVCYAGSGYRVGAPSRFAAAGGGELFTTQLVKTREADQTRLRIFWAWNPGDGWAAADNPRLDFSGQRQLYKMYLIREMAGPNEPLERDPGAAFLPVLLPELQKTLFARS